MKNYENGKTRPTYFCIKDDDLEILWFIPMSSKVKKYKVIRDEKIKKYGSCDTILIKKFLGKNSVFLLQNMFPTIEKYVDHIHTINGKEVKVIKSVEREIKISFNKVMTLIKKGHNIIFTDVKSDLRKMLIENEKEIK